MVKKILLILIVLLVWLIPYHRVSSQSPTSVLNNVTVHSQDILADFFAWLGGILFKNQIADKVILVNEAALPIYTNIKAVNTVTTNDDALNESSKQYDTAAGRSSPFNQSVENRNFIQTWWENLTQAVPTGTQQATNYYSSTVPFGVAEVVLPTPGDENSAMAFALDCKKDSNLPLGAISDSKCIPGNQPVYVSPTPTPTPTNTPTPTPTPVYNPIGPDLIGYIVPTTANQYPYYDSLPYHIPYNKKADPPATVDTINSGLLTHIDLAIAAAKSKRKTSMLDHWREVYDAAVAQGWNAAFVLAVWIEETGASDACTIGYPIIDFGVGQTYTRCNDHKNIRNFRISSEDF